MRLKHLMQLQMSYRFFTGHKINERKEVKRLQRALSLSLSLSLTIVTNVTMSPLPALTRHPVRLIGLHTSDHERERERERERKSQ